MTKRCHHEIETKEDYPDDRICRKCGTVWSLTEIAKWGPTQLMTLPLEMRQELLKLQAAKIILSGGYAKGDWV